MHIQKKRSYKKLLIRKEEKKFFNVAFGYYIDTFKNFQSVFFFRFASRTRARVGRAFSFNKTPSKLNRAMSTIMSPFGSTQSLPPTNQQIAQMRLGSCNNISVS